MGLPFKYIYFSRFVPDIHSGGGCRRLVQMEQIFAHLGFKLISSRENHPESKVSYLTGVLNVLKSKFNVLVFLEKYFVTNGEYFFWHRDHRDFVFDQKDFSHRWARLIRKSSNIKLAMVDDPIYFSPLVKKLKRCGIRIVAMCHNIESLSYGQVNDRFQRFLFNKELDMLSLCDVVMVSSREETVMLTNLGINAFFFPYYPADKILHQLYNIRESRKNSKKKDILLLGSVGNKPTRLGMTNVITIWKKNNFSQTCGKLLVAGWGTESLRDIAYGNGIELLGPLTHDELKGLLKNIRACLCYQDKGAGALTRIYDMLIAGIPVLSNTHAARSYYNLNGVIQFSSFNKFQKALGEVDFIEGKIPIPKPPDLSDLVTAVSNLI